MQALALNFCDYLDSLESQVRLIEDLRRFGSSRLRTAGSPTRLTREAERLRNSLRTIRYWETTSLDGCVLSLAAQYEVTVRYLAERATSLLMAKVRRYQDLPQHIRTENTRLVGEALSIRQRRFASLDHWQVVQDLAGCLGKGKPVRLFCAGFGMPDHNLTSDELARLFSRIDLRSLWPQLGGDMAIMQHLGTITPESATTFARNKLDGFIEARNQIAHRGPSYETLGPTVILDYAGFFKCLIPALAEILQNHVSTVT